MITLISTLALAGGRIPFDETTITALPVNETFTTVDAAPEDVVTAWSGFPWAGGALAGSGRSSMVFAVSASGQACSEARGELTVCRKEVRRGPRRREPAGRCGSRRGVRPGRRSRGARRPLVG